MNPARAYLLSMPLLALHVCGCVLTAVNNEPAVIACWDLNGNGQADADEDFNGDGAVDALDCRGPQGPAGLDGQDGAEGPPGADGQDAPETLYGDGSSGAREITGDTRFETASDVNQLWTDFSVAAGATLRIQSGAVIRCTGSFVNYGTIVIETGAQGGARSGYDISTVEGVSQAPALGINTLVAASGEVGDASSGRVGGPGGDGISEFEAFSLLTVSLRAGSGGGAALYDGGAGGGGVIILAEGPVENFGTIVADGADASDGGGGGGGGVLLIASGDSITNAAGASLMVRGGAGGSSGENAAPGGGGGGGLIHLLAPVVDNAGSTNVDGGNAGTIADGALVTVEPRAGGGGGGGSAGAGGSGGDVPAGASIAPLAAEAGGPGRFLITLQQPTLLFR